MKINGEMFTALEAGLMETLKAHHLHSYMVKTRNQAWQVFHKGWNEQRIDGGAIYKVANDANIETAFRKIFRL